MTSLEIVCGHPDIMIIYNMLHNERVAADDTYAANPDPRIIYDEISSVFISTISGDCTSPCYETVMGVLDHINNRLSRKGLGVYNDTCITCVYKDIIVIEL